MNNSSKSLAILGAGKLGVVLAQLALQAGYTVFVAGSGSPEKIRLSVEVLAPGAIVMNAADAINSAEIVILALPLSKYRALSHTDLAGKLVIDAMNYWWEIDGEKSELPGLTATTSEMVQEYLIDSRVVKAISHIGYHHLHDDAKQDTAIGRKAIAIAGDNPDDNKIVAALIHDLGFEPFVIGSLSAGIHLEPGHPAFGAHVNVTELARLVSE